MKRPLILTTAILMILGTNTSVAQGDADNFYKSNSVNTEKVSFSNQYKMKVGARLFLPKELEEGREYPAVIVGHPMGASQGTERRSVRHETGRMRVRHAGTRPLLLG